MKSLGKIIFYGLSCLLWLVLLAGGLEVWARWRSDAIALHNPYILSRTAGKPWPIPESGTDGFSPWIMDDAMRTPYFGPGKCLEPLTPAAPDWELENRLPYFLAYDDFERQVSANVMDMNMLLINRNGQIIPEHSAPVSEGNQTWQTWVPAADIEAIQSGINTLWEQPSRHLFVQSNAAISDNRSHFGYCLIKADAENAWMLFRKRHSDDFMPEDSLWDAPFFSYKKQVRRMDHVNVLGLREDFYVNNFGFRDADLRVPKPNGTYRILCVGASTTEEGPTNSLTYPSILEAQLNRHFDTPCFDVVNCGVSGMNSLKHHIKTPEYLALQPDMIILYVGVNDICHDLFPIWRDQVSTWAKWLRRSWFINRHFNRTLAAPEAPALREQIERYKMPDLRYLIAHARKRDVRVVICSFAAPQPSDREQSDYYEHYTRLEWGGRHVGFNSYLAALQEYNEALRHLAETEQTLFIDLQRQLQGGAEYFGDICHLRNGGIEKKASIIAEHLIRYFTQETEKEFSCQ